eukprot:Polyplicarium_translucidae@DN3248_c0_g1_i15.p2
MLRPAPIMHRRLCPFFKAVQLRWQNLQFRLGRDPRRTTKAKERVVVLGTGWGAIHFLRSVDVTKYEVVVVSPRNFFVFTPFLPSVCAGTLSARAAVEPIRSVLLRGGKPAVKFYEAHADDVDIDKKTVTCTSKAGDSFTLPYDDLVVSVGAESNTFGIPGVQKNSLFLKELEHAQQIRTRFLDNFERASLPGVSDKEKRRLLHFVCVGGGPTGVECAAEMSDFLRRDGRKHFPDLVEFAQVTLVEMLPKVLPMFSEPISEFTLKNFHNLGIEALMRSKVTKISEREMTVEGPDGVARDLPYGLVVWASGIGQVPLNKRLIQKLPAQSGNRVLNVDEQLKLVGAPSVYAIGDCAFVKPPKLQDDVDRLYKEAADHVSGAGAEWIRLESANLARRYPQVLGAAESVLLQTDVPAGGMSRTEFHNLLKRIDATYKPPAPTAANAKQMGRYLATIFNSFLNVETRAHNAPAFVPVFQGRMAYVGGHQGVADLPITSLPGGRHTGLLWKGVYWGMQMSMTNRAVLAFDWAKTLLRGRDVGRSHQQEVHGWSTGTPCASTRKTEP